MNTREIAEEYRLTHWAGVMRERHASGLSIKAFCKTAGLHPKVYFYWQRKLRIAACQALPAATGPNDDKAVIPAGWAVCEEAEANESGIIIEIGKFRVTVGPNTSAEQLEKVCRTLIRLC